MLSDFPKRSNAERRVPGLHLTRGDSRSCAITAVVASDPYLNGNLGVRMRHWSQGLACPVGEDLDDGCWRRLQSD